MVSLDAQDNFRKISKIIEVFIYIGGIIVHLLLFNAFVRDPLKCLRNLKMVFVINLAISDFLFCLISLFRVVICTTTKTCTFVHFLVILIASVSCLTIPSISVDRFLLVVYPIKHRFWITRKVIAVWLSVIWFISVSYSTKRLIVGVEQNYEEPAYGCLFVVFFISTLIVYMSVCYALKKQSRKITKQSEERGSRAEELRLIKEKKFMQTIIFVALITVIGFTPQWFLTHTVKNKILSAESLAYVILHFIAGLLFVINFSINPVIYVLRFPNFRKTFEKLYSCM